MFLFSFLLGTSRISFATSALTSNEDVHKSSTFSSFENQKCQAKLFHTNPIQLRFQNKKLVFFNFQRCNAFEKISNALYYNRSLCSMHCFTRLKCGDLWNKCNVSASTNAEQQIHITDLESNSINLGSSPKNTKTSKKKNPEAKDSATVKAAVCTETKAEPTTTYFFSRKKRNTPTLPSEPLMKKSKKCTNLVKYKNMFDEPKLKEPMSQGLLIKKRYVKSQKKDVNQLYHRGVACDVIPKEHNQVQAVEDQKHKSLQDLMTVSEYDKITEHLMVSLFENHKITHNANNREVKYYINQIVKELYDVKFSRTDVHPVKMLFRSLLEYWLKNTNGEQFKEALTRVKSVHKPSNNHFTEDKITSSIIVSKATKETQFQGVRSFINETTDQLPASTYKPNLPKRQYEKKFIRCHSPKRDTESFEKERRIQELERILKNTVYVCETVRSSQSREKDIKITKKLIDNLEKLSQRSGFNNTNAEGGLDQSNSSSELPKIQETINHLISETSLPPDLAKEFLSAYLGILRNESSRSVTNSSSQSSDQQKRGVKEHIVCDVQTESVQRKASKNVTTNSIGDHADQMSNNEKDQKHIQDPGELYLKDILDKITTIFSKVNQGDSQDFSDDKSTGDQINGPQDEFGRSVKGYPGKHLIHENYDENSVVIDLSKYNLEHISMFSDPSLKGMMSITIKLKEKPPNFGESKGKLSLKFCNEKRNLTLRSHSDDWLQNLNSDSLKKIYEPLDLNCKTNLYDCDSNIPKDTIELKPYVSSSDATSKKYYHIVRESEHSIDLSFQSSNFFKKDYIDDNEDTSCFIISSLKKLPLKMKLRSSDNNGLVLGPQIRSPVQSSSTKYTNEFSVVERPSPKVIDEKFILLLLENLTLLSKNVPSMYKDINTLYLKLKKRHEKEVRSASNFQGLSLLGRIYYEDLKLNNRGTQFENAEFNESMKKPSNVQDVFVSTSTNLVKAKSLVDQSLSANFGKENSHTAEVQTDNASSHKVKSRSSISNKCSKVSITRKSKSLHSIQNEIMTSEKAVSCTNWHNKCSRKDCAVSTVIKTILEPPVAKENFFIAPSKNFENVKLLRLEKGFPVTKLTHKKVMSIKKELAKGLAAFAPSLKISTQSQTDKVIVTHSKGVIPAEFSACNEFNIYQVIAYAREPQKSNSMIDTLSSRTLSDDLKTIYRCNSEPSYSSG